MKTDALLYDLFQTFPALFFELLGQDTSLAQEYRFASVEVKQIAFRLDGVFIPDNPTQPLYFLRATGYSRPALKYSGSTSRSSLPMAQWRSQ